MINLCFGDSAGGTLRYHNEKFRITDKIYCLNLYLHVGDISDPFSVKNRRRVYNIIYKGYANEVAAEIKQFQKALACSKKICIWYCANNTDEYLGFLYIVDYLKDKKIEIYSVDCGIFFSGIGAATDDEIINSLIPEPKRLSLEDISAFSNKWKSIVTENTFLRIIKDGNVLSLSEDSYDSVIFDIAGNDPIKVSEICRQMLFDHTPFLLVFNLYRIRTLIEKGEFVVIEKNYFNKQFYGYNTDLMARIIQRK